MTKKSSEILNSSAQMISRPFGWTKGRYARSNGIFPRSFCMVGAIQQVATGNAIHASNESIKAERYVAQTIGKSELTLFNDRNTIRKRHVVQALRQAAELARSNGD